jgi:glycerol-3-phosphate dehydrogenase
MVKQNKPKVVIIGGGLVGAAAAREMSRYDLDIIIIEKEPEVSLGISRASSCIIHPGFRYWEPGKLRTKAVKEGINKLPQISKELSVEYKEMGEIVVARNEEERERLNTLKKQGETNGLNNLKMISKDELKELEPNVTSEAIAALLAPTAAISSSFELCIALAESAIKNGVNIRRETEILGIKKEKNGFIIETNKGEIQADFIVNASGLNVDKIAKMVGDELPIKGVRGEEYIIDKKSGSLINHLIFPAKGPFVIPTIHGNLMLGTTQEQVEDYDDNAITAKAFGKIFKGAQSLIPDLARDQVIRGFAGVRANPLSGDIEITSKVPGFVSVCLGSPGIQTSLIVAEWIVDIFKKQGLQLVTRSDFDPYREPIIKFNNLSIEEKRKLVAKDQRYAHVVCRCETITEAEMVEAIRRGACTVDGVKYRTRAGMGRCQGGFCGPRVARIISRELGIPMNKVRKNILDSNYVLIKTKELLLEEVGGEKK